MTEPVNNKQHCDPLELVKARIRKLHHLVNTQLIRAEKRFSDTPSTDLMVEVAAYRGQMIGLTQGLAAISEVEEAQDEFKLFGDKP